MKAHKGFTLVELLVALAVMAILALLSWRSLDGMNRVQTLTQQRADALLRTQAALGQWSADLDAVFDTQELPPLAFDGGLLRLTRRDAADTGQASDGVRVVAWRRAEASATQPAQWTRWQSAPLRQRDELARAWQRAAEWATGEGASQAPDARDSALPLVAIDQWQLYYFRDASWGNPLSSTGNEDSPAGQANGVELPDGVRLVLQVSSGQAFSGRLVSDWVRPTLPAGR